MYVSLLYVCIGKCVSAIPHPLPYSTPSARQAVCWPLLLSGRDVVAQAPTGSGKTLAFLLPALVHLVAQPEPPEGSPERGER